MGRPPKPNLDPDLAKLLKFVGANLGELRRQHRLTLAKLAKQSNVSVTTINEIEKKRCRDIRLSTLTSLSKALGVPLLHLIMGTDVNLKRGDHAALLRASEEIVRITNKIRDQD